MTYQTINGSTKYLDIGVIIADTASGQARVLRCNVKNSTTQFVKLESPLYEPLSYPLFFQRGEKGWGVDMKKKNVPFNQYLKSRILQMDRGLYGKALLDPSFDMPCSRFQLLPRLGQVYFVDMLSRMEKIKLDFIRNNQSLIRGDWPMSSMKELDLQKKKKPVAT